MHRVVRRRSSSSSSSGAEAQSVLFESQERLVIPELSFSKATTWAVDPPLAATPHVSSLFTEYESGSAQRTNPISIFSASSDHSSPHKKEKLTSESGTPHQHGARTPHSNHGLAAVDEGAVASLNQTAESPLDVLFSGKPISRALNDDQVALSSEKLPVSGQVARQRDMVSTSRSGTRRTCDTPGTGHAFDGLKHEVHKNLRILEHVANPIEASQSYLSQSPGSAPFAHQRKSSGISHVGYHKPRSGEQSTQPEMCSHVDPASATAAQSATPVPASKQRRHSFVGPESGDSYGTQRRPAMPNGPRSRSHHVLPSTARLRHHRVVYPSPSSAPTAAYPTEASSSTWTPLETPPGWLSSSKYDIKHTIPNELRGSAVKRRSRLKKMLSSLLTPRQEAPSTGALTTGKIEFHHSSEGGGDYFSQAISHEAVSLGQSGAMSAPALNPASERAADTTAPSELKRHRQYWRNKMAEHGDRRHDRRSAIDETPGSSTSDTGSVARGGSPERQSHIPVRAVPSEEDLRPQWFRQRLDEIRAEEDDNTSVRSLDWDIPLHLPSSPLCPLHPKYRGTKVGVCAYHGRRKTQPIQAASVEEVKR